MKINRECQCCERRPRTKAIAWWSGQDTSIWLLCDECTKPESKYSENARDVTEAFSLREVYLRDIKQASGDARAFIFKVRNDAYMSVPDMWAGASTTRVLDFKTRKTVLMAYDVPVSMIMCGWNFNPTGETVYLP